MLWRDWNRIQHYISSYQFCFPQRPAKQHSLPHPTSASFQNFTLKRKAGKQSKQKLPRQVLSMTLWENTWRSEGGSLLTQSPPLGKEAPAPPSWGGWVGKGGSTIMSRRHELLMWRGGMWASFVSKPLSLMMFYGSLWQSITPQKGRTAENEYFIGFHTVGMAWSKNKCSMTFIFINAFSLAIKGVQQFIFLHESQL